MKIYFSSENPCLTSKFQDQKTEELVANYFSLMRHQQSYSLVKELLEYLDVNESCLFVGKDTTESPTVRRNYSYNIISYRAHIPIYYILNERVRMKRIRRYKSR